MRLWQRKNKYSINFKQSQPSPAIPGEIYRVKAHFDVLKKKKKCRARVPSKHSGYREENKEVSLCSHFQRNNDKAMA